MSGRPLLPLALALGLLSCSGATGHHAQSSAPTSESDGTTANGSLATATESQEACSFAESYRLEWSGGMVPFRETYTLQPPDRFTKVRDSFLGGDSAQRCEGGIPACESPDGLSVREVSARLTDSVVREDWPDSGQHVVGRDLRPVDAPLMVVTRESGGSLLIGVDCRDAAGCTPVPPEVGALRETLGQLARQISSTEACAGLAR